MRSRIPRVCAALALALVLAGCGDRNLVVDVDVLSFLDPSVVAFSFGPVPALPGGVYTGELAVVQDAEINLVERPSDLASVASVSLVFEALATDSTGSGADTLRIYMSDPGTDPLTTPAVLTLPASLVAGQQQTVHAEVEADQRLATVFNGNRVRLSMTNALRGPDSGAPLNGRVRISAIRAVVIANRKGL